MTGEVDLHLQVIVASTRPGRKGISVGRWIEGRARAHGGFSVELVDLAEIDLPLFNEAAHPKLGTYEHQHTRDWSTLVSRGDAYVLVFPEYNHSFPATLKNALDYLSGEWANKAVGLVSYGGVAAGARAAAALKPVLGALRMTPVVEAATIPFFTQFIDDEGVFTGNAELDAGTAAMLDELVRMTRLLRPGQAST